MAVPKRKTSTARRDKRRTHWKMEVKRPHRVCPVCGYYNGVEVINMKDAEA